MNTFIASSCTEKQVRYIYKHYTELQGCLPKLQTRCLQTRKFKSIYKGRQTQSNSKQVCEAEIANAMNCWNCKALVFTDQVTMYDTKLM